MPAKRCPIAATAVGDFSYRKMKIDPQWADAFDAEADDHEPTPDDGYEIHPKLVAWGKEYPLTPFPFKQDIFIPQPPPPTKRELRILASNKRFFARARESPLYTVDGDHLRIDKPRSKKGQNQDPFNGMETYSKRYAPKGRIMPVFVKGTYNLNFFPKELWDTVEPKWRENASLVERGGAQRVHRQTAEQHEEREKAKRIDANDGKEDDELDEDDPTKKSIARKDGGDDDDEDNAVEKLGEDDEENAEEDPDENFEEGDSDMGGDYDAEQYFDDGEGDGDDFGGDDAGGIDEVDD